MSCLKLFKQIFDKDENKDILLDFLFFLSVNFKKRTYDYHTSMKQNIFENKDILLDFLFFLLVNFKKRTYDYHTSIVTRYSIRE